MPWSERKPITIQEAKNYGLRIRNLSNIQDSLKYETLVSVGNAKIIGQCEIGFLTYIGFDSRVRNTSIGRFCSIAPNVLIGPDEHPVDRATTHPFSSSALDIFEPFEGYTSITGKKAPLAVPHRTVIGNDVWIGDSAFISGGVTIGDGAVIGAHSVITRDVEPYSIMVGCPARKIRNRFDQKTINKLSKIKWWDYDLTCFKDSDVFYNTENLLKAFNLKNRIFNLEKSSYQPFLIENEERKYYISSFVEDKN